MRRAILTCLMLALTPACSKADSLDKHFRAAGRENHVPALLLRSVAQHEGCMKNARPCGGPYCNPWRACGIMQVRDVTHKYENDIRGNIGWGARHLVGCGVRTNVIEALVCYNAGQGTVDGLHNGNITPLRLRFWIPGKGWRSGLVPRNWRCPGKDCVRGYVTNIIVSWQDAAHSHKGNTVETETVIPTLPPASPTMVSVSGISTPTLLVSFGVGYVLYRRKRRWL
jgi:hypothetical protein